MAELYLNVLVHPWPLGPGLLALLLVLGRWRLESPAQLVDVALGALVATALAGKLTITWGMPLLDGWTGLQPEWRWPLYVGAGLLLGLGLPVRSTPNSMLPGLALGFVLARTRLTDADVVASWDVLPYFVVGTIWLLSTSRSPTLLPRVLGGALMLATPALVAAQVGMGRLTAGVVFVLMLGVATLRRRGRP
jgi:hypothetical protein